MHSYAKYTDGGCSKVCSFKRFRVSQKKKERIDAKSQIKKNENYK